MSELYWIYLGLVAFWVGVAGLLRLPLWAILVVAVVVAVVGWVAIAVCIGGARGAENKVHK